MYDIGWGQKLFMKCTGSGLPTGEVKVWDRGRMGRRVAEWTYYLRVWSIERAWLNYRGKMAGVIAVGK